MISVSTLKKGGVRFTKNIVTSDMIIKVLTFNKLKYNHKLKYQLWGYPVIEPKLWYILQKGIIEDKIIGMPIYPKNLLNLVNSSLTDLTEDLSVMSEVTKILEEVVLSDPKLKKKYESLCTKGTNGLGKFCSLKTNLDKTKRAIEQLRKPVYRRLEITQKTLTELGFKL